MVLLRFFGFAIFCQIYVSLLVLLPLSGVIIWVLLIYLLIRSFMLVQSMLRSIITLFVIETKKEIQIRFIPSKDQLADVLTKPLASSAFTSLRSKLHMDNPPSA